MSHSTVLVTKTQLKSIDDQLARFYEQGDENDSFMEWVDQSEEYRKQYEKESVSEFYCASHSSWGFELSKDIFDRISSGKVGSTFEAEFNQRGLTAFLKPGEKYRGYHLVEGEKHKRSEDSAWFEFIKITETDRSDLDFLSKGKGLIKVIEAPKQIALKDKYPDYNTYLEDWHGVEDPEKQGYLTNPDAKWDWYQIGGRWSGYFKVKAGGTGEHGTHGLMDSHLTEDGVDVIKVKDIDWEAMEKAQRERYSKYYDEEMAKPEASRFTWDREKPIDREAYISSHLSLSTFAVLHDDQWYEQGDMGWWGIVSDKKDPAEWDEEFRKLIDSLDPEDEVTVVDVHI